jgi:hypothetical protein
MNAQFGGGTLDGAGLLFFLHYDREVSLPLGLQLLLQSLYLLIQIGDLLSLE